MSDTSWARAEALLASSPLIDGHNDLPWAMRNLGYDFGRADIGSGTSATQTDIPRLRKGGVGGQFWSVYVPSSLPPHEAVTATLEQIDFVHQLVERFPDDLALAVSANDIEKVFATGRVASLIGAEGGHCIAESLGVLRSLYELGVRYMTLTHNDNVPWADAATDEPAAGGLTDFGRSVVAEMNRLGMLVDLSHVAPATMADALATSQAPVIFSHSSCRALVDHPRNVPDDILAELPRNGGVCMVAFVPKFVSSDDEHATVADVVAHIEHVRAVAGVDHIGIGGDYDGCPTFPAGLEDVSRYPAVFAELLDRGWSDEDCARLAGVNVLRVLRDAEAVAAKTR